MSQFVKKVGSEFTVKRFSKNLFVTLPASGKMKHFFDFLIEASRTSHCTFSRLIEESLWFFYISAQIQPKKDSKGRVYAVKVNDSDPLFWQEIKKIPNCCPKDPMAKKGKRVRAMLEARVLRLMIYKGAKILQINQSDLLRRILVFWALNDHPGLEKILKNPELEKTRFLNYRRAAKKRRKQGKFIYHIERKVNDGKTDS